MPSPPGAVLACCGPAGTTRASADPDATTPALTLLAPGIGVTGCSEVVCREGGEPAGAAATGPARALATTAPPALAALAAACGGTGSAALEEGCERDAAAGAAATAPAGGATATDDAAVAVDPPTGIWPVRGGGWGVSPTASPASPSAVMEAWSGSSPAARCRAAPATTVRQKSVPAGRPGQGAETTHRAPPESAAAGCGPGAHAARRPGLRARARFRGRGGGGHARPRRERPPPSYPLEYLPQAPAAGEIWAQAE